MANNFSSIDKSKIGFSKVFSAFNPMLSVFQFPFKLNFVLRLIYFANYILFISLFTLSHLAILNDRYR